jgi:predicted nucleic acid-binding protein
MIFLDTDIMVDILQKYPPALSWLNSLGEERIVLSGFVVMELLQGCRNKAEQKKLSQAISGYTILWPSPEACGKALSLFTQYFLSDGLGMLDALIGSMCLELAEPLYTFNQRHYSCIPGLRTVQPYAKNVKI